MLGLPELGRGSAVPTPGIHQFGGVKGFAAVITLVAARAGILTVGARTLDIAVGEETFAFGAIGLRSAVFIDIVLIKQSQEHILGNFGMISRSGRGVQVPGNPEFLPRFQKLQMVTFRDFSRPPWSSPSRSQEK